jgi:Na+-driven multidrug efflux pump
MVAWLIFFLFIEKLGKHELAISNVVRGAYMIAMTPIWGFSVAANSMVSNIIGQNLREAVIGLINKILAMTFITTILMCSILLLFSEFILGIFSTDQLLLEHSLGSYYVVVISLFFFATAIVLISAVSGTGATRTALNIEIIAILLYMVYIYYTTFISKSSVEVVWLSELVYWTFIGGASYLFLWSGKWKSIRV